MNSVSKITLTILFAYVCVASAAWLPNVKGQYSYDDPANWENGLIDGVFTNNNTSKAAIDVLIPTSRVYDMDIGVTGEFYFYLRGENGPVTLTLTNDLNLAASSKVIVGFGSENEANELDIDLGGVHREISSTSNYRFYNKIKNGSFTANANTLSLVGSNGAIAPDVVAEIKNPGAIRFGLEGDSNTGLTRATDLHLNGAELYFQGHKTGGAAVDRVETLRLSQQNSSMLYPIMKFFPRSHNKTFSIGSLLPIEKCALLLESTNNFGKDVANNGCFLKVDGGIETIGGTEFGVPTAPIIPWIAYNSTGALFTYDSELGLRALDTETEIRTYLPEEFDGHINGVDENIMPSKDLAVFDVLDAESSVNSISSDYATGQKIYFTNGVVRVKSGVLRLLGYDRVEINGNIDFGNVPGVIWHRAGKVSNLNGNISGSNGLVTYTFLNSSSESLNISATADFTGDVFINSGIYLHRYDFLPHGDRLGDTYVNSSLRVGDIRSGNVFQPMYINGLNGSGRILLSNNYTARLFVGDNNASGHFKGWLQRNSGTFSLEKIGTGTQIIDGDCTHNSYTRVNAGSLYLNGVISTSDITVKDGAVFGGKGSIEAANTAIVAEAGSTIKPGDENGIGTMTVVNDVTMEDTSKLAFTFTSADEVSAMNVGGNVLGADANVDVTLDGDLRAGNYLLLSGASLEPNFVSNTPNVLLRKENGGTELWATVPQEATLIVIR